MTPMGSNGPFNTLCRSLRQGHYINLLEIKFMSQSELDNSTQRRRLNMCLRSQVRSSPEDTDWEKVNQSHSNGLLDRGHILISLEQSRFHRDTSSTLASLPYKNNPLPRFNIRQTTGHYSSHQSILVLELLFKSNDSLGRPWTSC